MLADDIAEITCNKEAVRMLILNIVKYTFIEKLDVKPAIRAPKPLAKKAEPSMRIFFAPLSR